MADTSGTRDKAAEAAQEEKSKVRERTGALRDELAEARAKVQKLEGQVQERLAYEEEHPRDTSSAYDKVYGTTKELKGKIKETIGAAVGDELLEARGKVDKLEGQAQKKLGDLKKEANDLKSALDQ